METSAAADTVTTLWAIDHGHVEMNPLGIWAITAGKVMLIAAKDSFDPEFRDLLEQASSSVWWGATVNNLLVIWGSGLALPLGVLTAVWIYTAWGD